MDRIDAMRVFVTALDTGSLAGAGRRLRKSPAAVSRAIAFLESYVGTPLLHRTTRTIKLSEAGERYAAACRRVLTDLEEADMLAAGESAAPRGVLNVTGPVASGAIILRPILDAYLDAYPSVKARLLLLDRKLNMVEEGQDVALRIGHLPDSSLMAIRIGEVRQVICAAPSYLAKAAPIRQPADVSAHQVIALMTFGQDSWSFVPTDETADMQQVPIAPRLIVNTVEAAVGSAVEGNGLTRLFSYQVASEVRDGKLVVVLPEAESPALPVHVVTPEGRLSVPKVRAFVDFAVPRLKAEFARLADLRQQPKSGSNRSKGQAIAALGLKHGVNMLVDYDPSWAIAFAVERDRIATVLGKIAKGIEHYGSTAVVGMRAKPIIDMLVGVHPLSDWTRCLEPLVKLGYDYAENAGVPGHYIFGKGRDTTERTHLVHVVEFEGESWRSNLALRDALRADASLRQAYVAVKEAAITNAPVDRARYNELKRDFIDAAKAKLKS